MLELVPYIGAGIGVITILTALWRMSAWHVQSDSKHERNGDAITDLDGRHSELAKEIRKEISDLKNQCTSMQRVIDSVERDNMATNKTLAKLESTLEKLFDAVNKLEKTMIRISRKEAENEETSD